MQELLSGQNIVLDRKQFNISIGFTKLSNFNGDIDSSAFLLSKSDKIDRDEDFVFYNQPVTPDGSVKLTPGTNSVMYAFDLDKVPLTVDKIALTIVIDGQSTIAGLSGLNLTLDGIASYPVPLGAFVDPRTCLPLSRRVEI